MTSIGPLWSSLDPFSTPETAIRARKAAEAFAALLWQEVLASALGPEGLLPGGDAGGVYGALAASALAEAIGHAGGGGIAALVERWLTKHAGDRPVSSSQGVPPGRDPDRIESHDPGG